MQNKKVYIFILFFILNFIGCATVPTTPEPLAVYNINGINYLPLIPLCESKGIKYEYDTFTKIVLLKKDNHKISLRLNDTLMLVDGKTEHLSHPVELYQGTVVVPHNFEQVLLNLFKLPYPTYKLPPLAAVPIRRIIIDPGHGGVDPGTISKSGLKEKIVNLDIAKRLAKILKERGFEIIMTRNTDKFVSLRSRVDIANQAKADLFISIHANANRLRSLSGFEIYYISAKMDNDTKRALSTAKETLPNLEDTNLINDSLDLRAIIWDMIYTANRAEAVRLSQNICRSVDRALSISALRIKEANFYILKGAQMPAILIELGYLSNPQEERQLRNSYYRQQIAEAIAQGIENYIRDYISGPLIY